MCSSCINESGMLWGQLILLVVEGYKKLIDFTGCVGLERLKLLWMIASTESIKWLAHLASPTDEYHLLMYTSHLMNSVEAWEPAYSVHQYHSLWLHDYHLITEKRGGPGDQLMLLYAPKHIPVVICCPATNLLASDVAMQLVTSLCSTYLQKRKINIGCLTLCKILRRCEEGCWYIASTWYVLYTLHLLVLTNYQ